MSYQNPPTIVDEDETAVLVVTPRTPPPPTSTTRTARAPWRAALVAGMLLLLLLVLVAVGGGGGGMVGRKTPEGSLLLATEGRLPCVPATGNFQGTSTTTTDYWGIWGKDDPFETCYRLDLGDEVQFCWSKSYQNPRIINGHNQCIPYGDGWKAVEYPYWYLWLPNPNHQCGVPCKHVYQQFS